jgi:hypothetical protein
VNADQARVAGAVLVVGALVASCGDGDSASTTTGVLATTADSPVATVAVPTTERDLEREDIASSVFGAWTTGDLDAVREVADAAVTGLLNRLAPSRVGWDGPACEGAAGSTYCTWSSAEETVVLRVANADARVVEVRLEPPPGGVALWPLTTAEEAANTQQSVDEGHSPWQLEPGAVALSYAENILGFEAPGVDQTVSDLPTLRVTDTSGASVDVTLVQPERTGPGGIWAIASIRS